MRNLLVFPFDQDKAQAFSTSAASLGFSIFAGTSTKGLACPENYRLVELPHLNDPDFVKQLDEVIKEHKITDIYTAHDAVWFFLNKLRSDERLAARLCEPHPFDAHWAEYAPSLSWAKQSFNNSLIQQVTSETVQHGLDLYEYAYLHHLFVSIPGQCSTEKLFAIAEIFRILPAGDIVEIGSLFGRTSTALAYLSDLYDIGTVLSIDPWSIGMADDQGDQATVLNEQRSSVRTEHIYEIYKINSAVNRRTGHIQNFSEQAYAQYREATEKPSELVREAPNLAGNIALLHIDGNHRYDYVKKDLELWCRHAVSGAWVLVDDYQWGFGDGPKVAGDEFLAALESDCAFCLGKTLFVRVP